MTTKGGAVMLSNQNSDDEDFSDNGSNTVKRNKGDDKQSNTIM